MDSPSAVSFDISGLTRSESFARIDAEIICLHDQIRSLQGLRNTVAPISSIPNELLSKIFLHSHDADADLDFNQGHSRLTIAWVSHHWRSVALGCSKLWAVVTYQNLHSKPMTCDGLEYARACFERSNNTDMSVLLCKPPKNLVEVCLRHIHQLRDVQLGGEHYHSRIEVPWSLLWGNPAPRLASLYLENSDFPTPSTDETSLFSRAHPQLRQLILRSCHFEQWQNIRLFAVSGLTTLHIHQPSSSVPATMILEILSSIPTLAEFEAAGFFEHDFAPPGITPLALPNLTKLTLDGEAYFTFGLLHRLHLPAASIHIILDDSTTSEESLRKAFRSFQACQARFMGHNEDICHIFIQYDHPHIIVLTSTTSPPVTPSGRQFSLKLTPYHYDRAHFDPAIWSTIYLSFMHASLRTLSLDGISSQAMLKSLPLVYQARNLEVVKIQNIREWEYSNRSTVLQILNTLERMPVSSELLPSIRELDVDGVQYETVQDFHNAIIRAVNTSCP